MEYGIHYHLPSLPIISSTEGCSSIFFYPNMSQKLLWCNKVHHSKYSHTVWILIAWAAVVQRWRNAKVAGWEYWCRQSMSGNANPLITNPRCLHKLSRVQSGFTLDNKRGKIGDCSTFFEHELGRFGKRLCFQSKRPNDTQTGPKFATICYDLGFPGLLLQHPIPECESRLKPFRIIKREQRTRTSAPLSLCYLLDLRPWQMNTRNIEEN